MKKILWLVNIPLPEVAKLMGKKETPLGGWLVNFSEKLSKNRNIQLVIAFPDSATKYIKKYHGENITYYAFKQIKKSKQKKELEQILVQEQPDIVHIHGTEFEHTLAMVEICEEKEIKIVVSIQGLVSVYSNHMTANLPLKAIYGMTLRNFIYKDSVRGLIKRFRNRGKSEIESIKRIRNVIGRTTWDLACTKQINSNLNYHFCNESLRKSFYEKSWNIEKIEKYSIFLSQGQYSIKGLHYMLEALPIIKKKYPSVKVYISGKNIIADKTLREKLEITYYAKYIKTLIKKYSLEKNIIFTGSLSEEEICTRYLKSHVFVCPSTIENSPNSLGEAMILGVPIVTTNVGGIQDMLTHKVEGFMYQVDAPYMLAYHITKIFENDNLAKEISINAMKRAKETHDVDKNLKKMLEIYTDIISKN